MTDINVTVWAKSIFFRSFRRTEKQELSGVLASKLTQIVVSFNVYFYCLQVQHISVEPWERVLLPEQILSFLYRYCLL
jgi:hypothetical protein